MNVLGFFLFVSSLETFEVNSSLVGVRGQFQMFSFKMKR